MKQISFFSQGRAIHEGLDRFSGHQAFSLKSLWNFPSCGEHVKTWACYNS